jgi:hypothetical protein
MGIDGGYGGTGGHAPTAFPGGNGSDKSPHLHDDPLASFEKSLKAILTSIQSTKHTTKALAGAVGGLRGAAAYDALVADAARAVKNLRSAHHDVTKVDNIIKKEWKPSADLGGKKDAGTPSKDVRASKMTESSLPTLRLFEIHHSLIIKRNDYRKFLYFFLSVPGPSDITTLVNAEILYLFVHFCGSFWGNHGRRTVGRR